MCVLWFLTVYWNKTPKQVLCVDWYCNMDSKNTPVLRQWRCRQWCQNASSSIWGKSKSALGCLSSWTTVKLRSRPVVSLRRQRTIISAAPSVRPSTFCLSVCFVWVCFLTAWCGWLSQRSPSACQQGATRPLLHSGFLTGPGSAPHIRTRSGLPVVCHRQRASAAKPLLQSPPTEWIWIWIH